MAIYTRYIPTNQKISNNDDFRARFCSFQHADFQKRTQSPCPKLDSREIGFIKVKLDGLGIRKTKNGISSRPFDQSVLLSFVGWSATSWRLSIILNRKRDVSLLQTSFVLLRLSSRLCLLRRTVPRIALASMAVAIAT